jgi:hypothetical protein
MSRNYKVVWTEEKKVQAINLITDFFERHGHGELFMQSDNPIIEAPQVLANIADNVLGDKGIIYVEDGEVK